MPGQRHFERAQPMRRRSDTLLLSVAALFILSCSIDDADACGDNQTFLVGEGSPSFPGFRVCVCDEANGYVFDNSAGQGCKRCPGDKIARNGMCVSPETMSQDSDGGAVADATSDAGPGSGTSPTGLGTACDTNDDCAGFDATFCDVFMTHTCLIEKCATGENECPGSLVCCDYSSLVAGLSICLETDYLTSGNCPMGGMRVEP